MKNSKPFTTTSFDWQSTASKSRDSICGGKKSEINQVYSTKVWLATVVHNCTHTCTYAWLTHVWMWPVWSVTSCLMRCRVWCSAITNRSSRPNRGGGNFLSHFVPILYFPLPETWLYLEIDALNHQRLLQFSDHFDVTDNLLQSWSQGHCYCMYVYKNQRRRRRITSLSELHLTIPSTIAQKPLQETGDKFGSTTFSHMQNNVCESHKVLITTSSYHGKWIGNDSFDLLLLH